MSETGERGPKGDHGQHGDTGQTGRTGQVGDTGETGDAGKRGERGPSGDTGQTGLRGEPGPQGEMPPKLIRYWWIVGLVMTVVLAFATWQYLNNRSHINDNSTSIQGIKAVQRQLADLAERNRLLTLQTRKLATQVNRNRIADCERTSRLLVTLIQPGLKNLDKVSYYDEHPDEKRIVRQQVSRALELADPSHCRP